MSQTRKYYDKVIGYNYRLTNIQAAMGVAQVERIDEIIHEKRRVARTYREHLADQPVQFQSESERADPTYWMNTPLFRPNPNVTRWLTLSMRPTSRPGRSSIRLTTNPHTGTDTAGRRLSRSVYTTEV